jgi:hypothetical protein
MPERRVTPGDCALALAIPLTEGDFLADLRPDSPHDFAKSVWRATPRVRAEALFELSYGHLAGLARSVKDDVSARGVTVAPAATLDDLRGLLARFPVVTIVAHWRFPLFTPGDLIDAPRLLSHLKEPRSLVQRCLRDHLRERRPELLDPTSARDLDQGLLRTDLAGELNTMLAPARAHYTGGDPSAQAVASSPPLRLTRILLEEAFPEEIRGGAAFELRDGLHSAAAIIDAVPERFDGVIDLSVCNSIVLGEAIKRRRRECLIITNARPALPEIRLIRYQFVIRELAQVGSDLYTDAAARIHLAMLDWRAKS